MKQGLSLRVSQHLALTPQLQQSIRLLQLSTLELNQEVEQMLDDNPFLELSTDEAPREESGQAQGDVPAREDERAADDASDSMASGGEDTGAAGSNEQETAAADLGDESSWDGDGSAE
ncbi:MAG: RNA polymerase factor sigma-54, partial [Burkholderiaceae bacterium]